MELDVKDYIQSCVTCQQVKARRGRPFGLLQPMPIPAQPWDVVSMDFIVDLPESRGYNAIMVVIDYVSKQAHFVPTKPLLTALQLAKLFFKHIFKYHGMHAAIVSNRDPHFTTLFQQELFKLLDTQVRIFIWLIPKQMTKWKG